MQNMLQQLNWALLLSCGTKGGSPSHHYRKAWRKLLTTILNVQGEVSGDGLGDKLEMALARLHYSNGDYDGVAVSSLREFACAIEAQSGKRIRPADANMLVSATQEVIDVLMSG
ncbi:MAG: hypothetical protein ABIF19_21055 [Planctomycetota bacterium]